MINECKKMGIEVKAPDINVSFEDFRPIDKKTVSYGLNAIKNIATKVKAIVLCFCCLSLGILSDNLLFQTNMSNLSILYLSRMII